MPAPGASDRQRHLGPYRLESLLGQGAQGAVYLAQAPGGQRVALKVLRRSQGDDEQLRRFQREARVGAQLVDPGIVRVLDVAVYGETPIIAFEFVAGQTLKTRLGSATPSQAIGWIGQVARAVGVAHAQGVTHRDLKPSNVLVEDRTDRARVTDFGLAGVDRSSLTASGSILGTPVYMAPEMFRGDRVGPEADVYALGVMLYEALSGERPYEAPTAIALGQRVLRGGASPPRLPAGVSSAVVDVCMRALALEADERYPTAAAFAAALAGAANAAPGRRDPTRWVGLVVGLALAVTAVTVGVAWRRSAPTDAPKAAAPVEAPDRDPPGEPSPVQPSPSVAVAAARPTLPDADGRRLLSAIMAVVSGPGRDRAAYRATIRGLRDEIPALLAAYPDDSRVVQAAALTRLLWAEASDLLAIRRLQVEACQLQPVLPAGARFLCASLMFQLGFERAAVDCLLAGDPALDPGSALYLTRLWLLAEPPVQDGVGAERVARRLIAGDLGRGVEVSGDPLVIFSALANALFLQGQREAALEAYEEGFRRSPLSASPQHRASFAARLDAIRGGEVDVYENLARMVDPALELPWLTTLVERDVQARLGEPAAAASALAAERGADGLTALRWVKAAQLYRRAGEPEAAAQVLERAAGLPLSAADADVQSLVARRLARHLLDTGGDVERAERLARRSLDGATLTSGERADALVLVARACRLRGEPVERRSALSQAAALDPVDTRELLAERARGE